MQSGIAAIEAALPHLLDFVGNDSQSGRVTQRRSRARLVRQHPYAVSCVARRESRWEGGVRGEPCKDPRRLRVVTHVEQDDCFGQIGPTWLTAARGARG